MSEESEIVIPPNLEAAVVDLMENMPRDVTAEWCAHPRRKARALAHFGIGQWMRNNWGLWHGSELRDFLRKKFLLDCADNMSSLIFDCLWSDLNFKPRMEIKRYLETKARIEEEFPNAGNMFS